MVLKAMIWLILGVILSIWALYAVFGGEFQRQVADLPVKPAQAEPASDAPSA